jgi:ribonuclease HII
LIKIGIDESNYSPSLVGPCMVAVYTQRGQLLRGVKDSKMLNAKQRIKWYRKLSNRGDYVVTMAMPSDIARLGIYEARNQAAREAISRLAAKLPKKEPIQIHADTSLWYGIHKWATKQGFRIATRKGGDGWVWAASIFAKVNADAMFYGWGKMLPAWGPDFGRGSIRNRDKELLIERGPTPFHRARGYAKEWWNKILNK